MRRDNHNNGYKIFIILLLLLGMLKKVVVFDVLHKKAGGNLKWKFENK